MPQPACQRDTRTRFEIKGYIQDYVKNITDQWLLIAPKANPAMLEMFRDRDAAPLRGDIDARPVVREAPQHVGVRHQDAGARQNGQGGAMDFLNVRLG